MKTKTKERSYLLLILFLLPLPVWAILLAPIIFAQSLGIDKDFTNYWDDSLVKWGLGLAITITAICLLLLTILVIHAIKKHNILKRSGINQIDQLTPFEFENWVTRFFQAQGYRAYTTQKSGDYGIDVIAEKDHQKIAIQVKKYNQPVGIKAVQEAISGAKYYDCHEAWVVTSADKFTTAAYNLANKSHVKLITRTDLANLYLKHHHKYK